MDKMVSGLSAVIMVKLGLGIRLGLADIARNEDILLGCGGNICTRLTNYVNMG